MHIIMMRDLFPHLPVALNRVEYDCCEDLFSLLGQQVTNNHNFCLGEAIECTSHIGRTEQSKYDNNAPLFSKACRKKNIW